MGKGTLEFLHLSLVPRTPFFPLLLFFSILFFSFLTPPCALPLSLSPFLESLSLFSSLFLCNFFLSRCINGGHWHPQSHRSRCWNQATQSHGLYVWPINRPSLFLYLDHPLSTTSSFCTVGATIKMTKSSVMPVATRGFVCNPKPKSATKLLLQPWFHASRIV